MRVFCWSFIPSALSSPFIRGQIRIDLCQTAWKQRNHIKEVKENAKGLTLTSPEKKCHSAGVSIKAAFVFPRAVSVFWENQSQQGP